MGFGRQLCSLANHFVINLGQNILGSVVRVVGYKEESPWLEPQGARDVTYSQPVFINMFKLRVERRRLMNRPMGSGRY